MNSPLPRKFLARQVYARKMLLFAVCFFVWMVVSLIGFTIDPPVRGGFAMILLSGLLFGSFSAVFLWEWRNACTGWLEVDAESVTKQGWFYSHTIAFDDVESIFWAVVSPGSIALTSKTGRVRIDLDWFEPEEQLWIIRFIRTKLPDLPEKHWKLFCERIALPLRTRVTEPPDPPTPEEIRNYQRRWDLIFLPTILISIAIAGFSVWQMDNWRLIALPLVAAFGYWFFRFRKKTIVLYAKETSAEKTPESEGWQFDMLTLFVWGGLCCVGIFFVPDNPVGLIVLAIVFFAGIFFWAFQIDKRHKPEREARYAAAMEEWDAGEREEPHF